MAGDGWPSSPPAQRRLDADDHYGDVVGPAAEIGQIHQGAGGLGRGKTLQQDTHFLVFDRAGEPIAAEQKVSPTATGNGPSTSTWTEEFGPSDRVMTFLGM